MEAATESLDEAAGHGSEEKQLQCWDTEMSQTVRMREGKEDDDEEGEGLLAPLSSAEQAVEGDESANKRRRVSDRDDELETEEDVAEKDPADYDEFYERMQRHEIVPGTPVWRALWEEKARTRARIAAGGADLEVDGEAAAEENVENSDDELRDADGAIAFEGQTGEGRHPRLPAEVPVPSAEMVRRHRAAGHCPYRPWCAHCVRGAANAPGHDSRADPPLCGFPEVHADYAFFRDKKGDYKNTVTVLVIKEREKSGIAAHVVPKKGAGAASR